MITRSLNKSCSECTRRKIKCDGSRPCNICSTFGRAATCAYRPRSKRQTTSRSAYDEAVKRADSLAEVLERLFPSLSLSDIVKTPRDELLSTLIEHSPRDNGDTNHSAMKSTASTEMDGLPRSFQFDDSATISGSEEEEQERRWEEPTSQYHDRRAADDVNAINLATEKHRHSYLGAPSMGATLTAIFRLSPCTKHHLAAHLLACSEGLPLSNTASSTLREPISTNMAREQRCVAFYFDTVHGITPLLDENDFRATHAAGRRQDRSWLALLNMVLALGSISSGSNHLHTHYYSQARSHLDFDCLGSGNLESLLALCLLGGYYLHYVNSPNTAYAVLGAAHRMAIALGLHRDSISRNEDCRPRDTSQQNSATAELRRRIWWSLFCLDTWSSMTLGRPTCGRWDSRTMDTKLPVPTSPSDYLIRSLISSSHFCLIIHGIQQRLAQFNRMTLTEVKAYDQELQRWHGKLTGDLEASSQSLPPLRIAQQFMSDRYLNARMMLYRCLLLYDAIEMIKTGNIVHGSDLAITAGLALVDEAIETITLHWSPSCFSVWSSTWYLFQACMFPLLSAAIATKTMQLEPNATIAVVDQCRATLRKAQDLFEELRPWMKPGDRGPDVIVGLSEGLDSQICASASSASDFEGPENSFPSCDEGFTEANWEALLVDNNWLLEDMVYEF